MADILLQNNFVLVPVKHFLAANKKHHLEKSTFGILKKLKNTRAIHDFLESGIW